MVTRRQHRRRLVVGNGMVRCRSTNEVTHPVTPRLQLTHLLPGPAADRKARATVS
jgi:hypothetical protein